MSLPSAPLPFPSTLLFPGPNDSHLGAAANHESRGCSTGDTDTRTNRGIVNNLRFENFYTEGAAIGPNINQDSGNNGSFSGTSNMLVSNIAFVNFTGFLAATSNRTTAVSCSTRNPCYNIDMQGISLALTETSSTKEGAVGTCKYIAPGGVHGMTGSGC